MAGHLVVPVRVPTGESQAEGQAEALAAAMTDALATKQDVADLRHERRMTMRLGGIVVSGIAILAAVVKLP